MFTFTLKGNLEILMQCVCSKYRLIMGWDNAQETISLGTKPQISKE